ncbi:MAG: class I SAM-dependent methyltransferase [Actinomycetes bacterium]
MEPTDFGPERYGRSFADVYDRWYPADAATSAAVEVLTGWAPPGTPVLELGVGTGRLALPLSAAGCAVTGMDASAEMLTILATKDPGGTVHAVRGDVARPEDWPPGRYGLVVAAFNLLLNLPDQDAQERCIRTAAAALAPGGHLVVETAAPALPAQREQRLDVRHVDATSVVLIATDADPATGTVVGQHVELVDGEPVRLRPWRVCACAPVDVDRWALGAGLDRVARRWGWDAPADLGAADAPIGVYRRPT